MRKLLISAGIVCALAAALPSRADAQVYLTPFAGATFNGDAPAHKLTYGGGLSFMGRVAGVELDFGYTPDFFNQQSEVALIADSNVTTAMGSLVFGPTIGPVRPYGVIGIGIIRSRISASDVFNSVSTNDMGLNAGVGVMGKVGGRSWLRGELRYFRSLQDPSDDGSVDVSLGHFDFWRGTIGLSLQL